MMGSAEGGVPICLTTFGARALRLRTLNGIALPIVPTGTIPSAGADCSMAFGLPPQAATIVIALMVGFAACSRPKRNSVLSTHIRCRMVASFRATATRARAIPRCLAIFMPHARKADHFCCE